MPLPNIQTAVTMPLGTMPLGTMPPRFLNQRSAEPLPATSRHARRRYDQRQSKTGATTSKRSPSGYRRLTPKSTGSANSTVRSSRTSSPGTTPDHHAADDDQASRSRSADNTTVWPPSKRSSKTCLEQWHLEDHRPAPRSADRLGAVAGGGVRAAGDVTLSSLQAPRPEPRVDIDVRGQRHDDHADQEIPAQTNTDTAWCEPLCLCPVVGVRRRDSKENLAIGYRYLSDVKRRFWTSRLRAGQLGRQQRRSVSASRPSNTVNATPSRLNSNETGKQDGVHITRHKPQGSLHDVERAEPLVNTEEGMAPGSYRAPG